MLPLGLGRGRAALTQTPDLVSIRTGHWLPSRVFFPAQLSIDSLVGEGKFSFDFQGSSS